MWFELLHVLPRLVNATLGISAYEKDTCRFVHQGNPHIRESRILASVRPRMQAASLQWLELQIAAASPDPQTHAFPGTELSQKTPSPNTSGGARKRRG